MPYEVASPATTAVVLVGGTNLGRDIETDGPWRQYVQALVDARSADPTAVGLFPVITGAHIDGSALADQVAGILAVAHGMHGTPDFEPTLCREVAQGIAQMGGTPADRVKVFVSHTKRLSSTEQEEVTSLVWLVRDVIASSRLGEFFDAHDLQPNEDGA